VGLCYIAVGMKDGVHTYRYVIPGNREQITETAKPIVPHISFMLETIPQDKISEILYSSFKDIVLGKCDIDIALEKGEETLKNIFIKYGYKQN